MISKDTLDFAGHQKCLGIVRHLVTNSYTNKRLFLFSTGWMARLAELSVGIGLGLHLPSQQLMVAETALPHQRYHPFLTTSLAFQ